MALLRDLLAVRRAAGRPLKVVLMSATLDSELFASYFGACPVLHAQVGWAAGGRCCRRLLEGRRLLVARAPTSASLPTCCRQCRPLARRPGMARRRRCSTAACASRVFPCTQGRTFPVEQLFLEDCYEATGECCCLTVILCACAGLAACLTGALNKSPCVVRRRASPSRRHRRSLALISRSPPPIHSRPPGYILDADSPAALRPQWDRRAQRRVAMTAGSKNAKAVQAGWGDALADAGPLNPHFKEDELRGYR